MKRTTQLNSDVSFFSFRRLTITGKVLYQFVGACAVIIIIYILMVFYSQYVRQQTLDLLDSRLSSQAHLRTTALQVPISNLQRNVRFLATLPEVQGIVRATFHGGFDTEGDSSLESWQNRLTPIFMGFATANPDVTQVRFIGISNNGKELLRVDRTGDQIALRPVTELQAKGSQKYFTETIKLKQGEVYLSDINLNRKHNKIAIPYVPTIRASTPVFSADGKLFGIIVINIRADSILSALTDNLFAGFKVYLTNSEGDYLQSPNAAQNFGFDLGSRHRWQDNFKLRADSPQDITHIQDYDLQVDSNTTYVHVYSQALPLDAHDPHRVLNLHIVVRDSLVSDTVNERLEVLIAAVVGSALLMGGAFWVYWRQRRKTQVAQARIAAIVESSNDAIIGLSRAGVITSWNKSAEQMFGYDASEALGRNERELCLSRIPDIDEENYQFQVSRGHTVPNIKTAYLQKNGAFFDASVTMAPIYNADGLVKGISKTVRDITEQNLTEQRIQRLNESLEQQVIERTEKIEAFSQFQRAILDNAGLAIMAADPEGHITLFNPAAERMLGYSEAEMLGQTSARFHDMAEAEAYAAEVSLEFGETIPVGMEAFTARTVRGLHNEHEWTFIRKDGTRFPMFLNITAWRDKNNQILGFLGMGIDNSQQRKDRQNLQLLTDHLNKAIQVADLGTWSWNVRDNSRIWSERMKEMYSVPPDAHPDSYREYWRSSVHPDDLPEALNALQRATDGLEPYHSIFRMILADGSIRHMQAEGLMEMGSDGKPLLMSGFNRDITTQLEHETALREAMASANSANLAKSAFLANMSHEIRTPMNAILGMQQLLHRTELDGRQLDYVSKTETAAKALLNILNDILDFSKVEAGKLVLDIHAFNLDRLLRDVGVILAANVGQKDVEVLFDIDPRAPSWIMGDALRLQQVLINIAGNAVKFTEVGEIVVSVRLIEAPDSKSQLAIAVSDTGIGIAPEAQQHIFDGFSQAESSTARRYGGSGLGLAISQRLVHMMGGEIGFESVLGVGTTFHFSIPCIPTDGPEIPAATAVAELKGLRVLVIDDNQQARQILTAMVSQFGWSAYEATSGAAALNLLNDAQADNKAFDVVLVDWRMPEMDGWETTARLKQFYADSISPLIVMVTAADRSKTTEQQEQLSAQLDGFLVKPITASMLFDAIADARAGRNAMSVVQHPHPTNQRLFGVRILVVEDNPTNRQVARELLSAEGAVVTVADDGRTAIETVAQNKFDVVLMDIQMPDMDGYAATREIRKTITQETLPIIALTANALATDREAAIDAGMNDHVGKPFDLTQLVGVINNLLGKDATNEVERLLDHVPHDSESSYLNVQDALHRFGGNKSVYGNALLNFGRDAATFLLQLTGFMSEDAAQIDGNVTRLDEQERFRQILHAFKGLAGTVGAITLHGIVAKAESGSIQSFKNEWLEFKKLVEDTITQATLVAQQMNHELSASNPASIEQTPPNSADLEPFMRLLRDSNMQALSVYEELKFKYAAHYPDQFDVLAKAVSQLDFPAALDCCEDLMKLWGDQ
ncbi:MAG: response regulator [Gammaproteobacteria bacterium]|nr:response regulator [Gammaproteobacteria bacterium]